MFVKLDKQYVKKVVVLIIYLKSVIFWVAMDYDNEQDAFEDIDETVARNLYNTLNYTRLVDMFVTVLLAIFVIVVDILLIYVIVKFKRLKSRVNDYIKHYAIFNILWFISAHLFHLVYTILYELFKFHSYYLYDIAISSKNTSLYLNFLYAFALSFDWLIMTFKPEIGFKIKRFYKHFILAIYTLGCLTFIIQLIFNFLGNFDIGPFLLSLIYALLLVFVIILDYLNYKYKYTINNTKPVYSLTIANIIVFSWFPMYIYHSIQLLFTFRHKSATYFIYHFTRFIPEWICLCTAIFVTVALVKINKYFAMSFRRIFKRCVKNYTDDENLDVSEINDNNFENNTNELFNNSTATIKLQN